MKDKAKKMSVAEALEKVMADLPAPTAVAVPLMDALGAVLAEDVVADVDMPPFDKAAMDGYAVRADDVASTPRALTVVDDIPAGKFPTIPVGRGEASRIMTGAPVPEGADAIVMVERTESPSPREVRILQSAKRGDHICRRGEDLRAGETVLRRGALIRPPEIAVLASVGQPSVSVCRPPAIAVMSTGDELVDIGARPGKGEIRNSNSYSVAAQVRAMGLSCEVLGVARDTVEAIRAMVRKGLATADVLILSGGVSAGEYDFVTDALREEGVECVLHQVMIKPGRPFYFGRRGEKRIFALPGNPVSTYVIFEVFVRPVLQRLRGVADDGARTFRARLRSGTTKPSDRLQFVPGRYAYADGAFVVDLLPWNGSADIVGLTRANALIVIPADHPPIAPGGIVDIRLMEQA